MARSVKQLYRTLLMLRRRIRDETCLDRFPKLLTADLVTIDVFDTALVRTLAHHDDVFALAAWRVVTRLGLGYNIGDLAADRRAAHRRALENAYAAGRKETTIENIYAHHPITDATIRAALLAEELATERDVCRANASILALFDSLTARGRRVSFLSDSPFPADFVSQLLSDAGYSGEFEVHVSSGFGTTKAHGNLYERVATKTGVSPAGMWHIGDNLESDVLRASEWGVTPLWYRPHLLKNRLAPADGSAASLARCVLVGTRAVFSKSGPATKRIGATIAGPVYLAFVQWLIEKLRCDPVAHIFFLARDAYILKAFYDQLRDPERDPPATYLVVSRRSLVFPLINSLDDAELDFLCSHERPLPTKDFFRRVGITPPPEALESHGLTLDTLIATAGDIAALRALFVTVAPLVLARAREERAPLLAYLAQEGFSPGQRFAICDVGWNGKSQRALAEILTSDSTPSHLSGYYVGTSKAIKRLGATGGTATGWLVDEGHTRFGVDVSKLSWALLELLFSAPRASVMRYEIAASGVEPVFRNESSNLGFQTAVCQLQQGANMFLKAYKRAFDGLLPISIDENEAMGGLIQLVASPTLAQATALGDVSMIEGMGDTHTAYAIGRLPSLHAVIVNPMTLISAYKTSLWRRGFAMRLLRSRTLASIFNGIIGACRKL